MRCLSGPPTVLVCVSRPSQYLDRTPTDRTATPSPGICSTAKPITWIPLHYRADHALTLNGTKVTGPSGEPIQGDGAFARWTPSRPSYNPELPGSSGICVGCCLGEDASRTAAPLAQSLSSRPRERRPARGRHRHAMVVGALVPPDAARGATVYTSAPKRLREAVFADLCTLLRVPTVARTILARCNSVHKCPKTARRGHFHRSVYTVASPPGR